MKILFMGGKEIGFKICEWMILSGKFNKYDIKFVINEYEDPNNWYRTPRSIEYVKRNEINFEEIEAFNPDIILVAFYDKILSKKIYKIPINGAWNLHLGDVERYRGAYPNVHALCNGDTEYAVTLHLIEEGIDTGKILKKMYFTIEKHFTGRDLYYKMTKIGLDLFKECIESILSGMAMNQLIIQDDKIVKTHYRKELNLEINITSEMKNKIRAYTFPPFPSPYVMIGGRKFLIKEEEKNTLKSTEGMKIREIKLSDAKEFSRLRSGENTYKWFYSGKKFTEEQVAQWISKLNKEKEVTFIAELDSKVVGTISLHDIDRTKMKTEVGRVVIDESMRGKGLGTKLLKYAIEYAEKQKFKIMYANIMIKNIGSQRIFEKNGFLRIEERPETGYHYEYKLEESNK